MIYHPHVDTKSFFLSTTVRITALVQILIVSLRAHCKWFAAIMPRKSYNQEQKKKDIFCSNEPGVSVTAAAAEFGITRRMLQKWRADASINSMTTTKKR